MPIVDPDPGRPDPTDRLLDTLRAVLAELRQIAAERPADERIFEAVADLEAGTAKLEAISQRRAAV